MALLLVAAACSSSGEDRRSTSVTSAASPAPEAQARDYPDLITRRLRRMASEPRPVAGSAMPPRHLDEEAFPETLVERTQIVSGGQPPDGIPAIDEPVFAPVSEVDWLDDEEAVLVLEVAGVARAYPIQIMMWHEIVNDVVGGVPVAVTYCPLCNSGVAFHRSVDGRVLDFGTSGALYRSGLVMYDRQTETLWTHFDGIAVVGTLLGSRLDIIPMSTVGWRQFADAHPSAMVLTRDTGFERPYGRNAYVGYDQAERPLRGFFTGGIDDRHPAMERVVGIATGSDSAGVTLEHLAEQGVVELTVGGRPVTVWHLPGLASALHGARVADGDDIGAVGVFVTDVSDGLSFARDGDRFVDDRTGSSWNIFGEAVDGALAGQRLEPVTHLDTFWFAWSSYHPDAPVVG